ncbi:MAG TPA: hypothetical protein VNA25_19590 [Phycisphaerae bacterium]|nr:hypothetical protein [Phycisphaerae bacterium]
MNAPLLADGFEDAILGLASWGYGQGPQDVVVYDLHKCAMILMARDGMTDDEAYEFLEFNTTSSWIGERTPLFVRRMNLEDINAMDWSEYDRGGIDE